MASPDQGVASSNQQERLVVFHSRSFPCDHLVFKIEQLEFVAIDGPEGLSDHAHAVLLLDEELARHCPKVQEWKDRFSGYLTVVAEDGLDEGDYLIPKKWPPRYVLKAFQAISKEMVLRSGRKLLNRELVRERGKMLQLTNIGLALSAETNLSKLLSMILTEGRSFAQCDAASLFLVEKPANNGDEPELVFKLTQNDSVVVPFNERRFPINKTSIAGFVAVTGKTLNLPDVYDLDGSKPYRFNNSFDRGAGYYSRSMLTIPMKNHVKKVIGVLQFINRKKDRNIHLVDKETTLANTLPFSRELIVLLEALASQAAVAIDNSGLLRRINLLFEGFVSAAVTAIEQRDPTTSGHSFRVAELTSRLAMAAPRSGRAKFRDFNPDKGQLREIRYASLLHDFGKVGVREDVLLKRKKLPEKGLEIIWHRFELQKAQIRNAALKRQLEFIEHKGHEAYRRMMPRFEAELDQNIRQMEAFYEAVARANEPTVLKEGNFKHLETVRDMQSFKVGDREVSLLTADEFLALSVKRGTLTSEERIEIQNHVAHTYNFLKEIPWTPELRRIPELALAHHEKLNGKGYPNGWTDERIPLPSKMMTIADIFDALTASDRPYKPSLDATAALEILEDEARRGLIDPDLVEIFIEAKVFQATLDHHSRPQREGPVDGLFNRHVCDYDLDVLHL